MEFLNSLKMPMPLSTIHTRCEVLSYIMSLERIYARVWAGKDKSFCQ